MTVYNTVNVSQTYPGKLAHCLIVKCGGIYQQQNLSNSWNRKIDKKVLKEQFMLTFRTWFLYLVFSKHRPSGLMLSISQNVRLSVCVSVCQFTFEVPFNGLFAPTSRSRMSNNFRDSESLGKSNRMKWSNNWTFLFGRGLKSPRKKKVFFCWFALVHPPMASVLLSESVERCFVSRMQDFFC